MEKKGPKSKSNCPECGKPLGRSGLGDMRLSKQAKLLFGVAAIVTGVWVSIIYLWSPVFLVPRSVAGFALCAVVYLGPGLLVGFVAGTRPKIRTMKCGRCGWSETVVHGL